MKAHLKFRAKSQLLYHYYGLVMGKLTVKVKMEQVTVQSGHAAVWGGCNAADNVSWIQAGISAFPGGHVEAYIERHQYGDAPRYTSIPLPSPTTEAVVHLTRTSYKHWKISISIAGVTHEADPVYIPRGLTIDAVLELWGPSSATCTIDGKTIKGVAKS